MNISTQFIAALERNGCRVKTVSDKNWMAQCPAHEDRNPSLSIREGIDGRLLLHCFAGCSVEKVTAAVGLGVSDLFRCEERPVLPPKHRPSLTLMHFAFAKRFPFGWLHDFGIIQAETGIGLHFPYFGLHGEPGRTRLRTMLDKLPSADLRFLWARDGKDNPILPYGLNLLPPSNERAGKTLWLVEGESDVIALVKGAGVHALGLPGANMTGKLCADHIEGFSKAIAVHEPDAGGDAFLSGVKTLLKDFGFAGEVVVAHMPDGLKDPADLWKRVVDENGGWQALNETDGESALAHCGDIFRRRLMESCGESAVVAESSETPFLVWTVARLSDIERRPVLWIWPPYIALGKLHCLYGLGGVGKTLIVIQWAAALTTGGIWPDRAAGVPPASVAYLTAEDGIEDTVLPRLLAAKGDPSRVFVFDNVFEVAGEKRFFNLSDHDCLEYLELKLREIEGLKLLIIDPITAFLGGADSHKIGDVRAALFPLTCLAERLQIAVIFIHHFNKAQGQNAIHRASGSTAFVDAVRIAIMACDNPDAPNERRVVKVIKSNLAQKPPGIGYVIHPAPEFDAARVEWEDEPVDKSDNELLVSASPCGSESVSGAEAFLRNALEEGERQAREVLADAKAAGFTEKEIRNARERLRIVPKRIGFGKDGGWLWQLPGTQSRPIDAIGAQSGEGASMGVNNNNDKSEEGAL